MTIWVGGPDEEAKLRRQIRERRAITVMGAGVSLAATANQPSAGWLSLVEAGIDRCKSLVGAQVAARMRDRLTEATTRDLLSLADEVRECLDERNLFFEYLYETIGKLEVRRREILTAIIDLNTPLLTTNYDSLFEQTLGLLPTTWMELHNVRAALIDRDDRFVVHMHGFWIQPQTVIFGRSDYKRLGEMAPLRELLRAAQTHDHFLFVGFGGGLSDPHFKENLAWCIDTLSLLGKGPHYILCRRGEEADLPPHAKDALCVLHYGDSHDDLAPYLKTLSSPMAARGAVAADRNPRRFAWERYSNLYRVGRRTLPYFSFVEGRFRSEQVAVERDPQKYSLPEAFQKTTLDRRFKDNESCRLVSYHQASETLSLKLARTTYGDYLRSGEHLDDKIADSGGVTFRQVFANTLSSGDMATPVGLTNICGVGVFLQSTDGKLVYSRHSAGSHVYPNRLTFSASGTMQWDDQTPFDAVKRRSLRELDCSLDPEQTELVTFGADARKLYFQCGFLSRLAVPAGKFIERARSNLRFEDHQERADALEELALDPQSVAEVIVSNCWEPAAEACLIHLCSMLWGPEATVRALEAVPFVRWRRKAMVDEWDYRASRPGSWPDMSVRYPADQLEQISSAYIEEVLSFLGESINGRTVVEFGCGTGRLTSRIVDRVSSLVCVDLCEQMIDRNKARLGAKSKHVTYHRKFGQELTLPTPVDVAISSLVLVHNVDEADFKALVEAMCRCASTVFVFEDAAITRPLSDHSRPRSRDEMIEAFAAQGLEVLEERSEPFPLDEDRISFLKFGRR